MSLRLQCSRHTLGLIIVGTLGLWLGFPNALLHIPPLALLYPIALNFLGIHACNKTDALRKGWITGLFGASTVLYWVAIPVHDVGNLPWPLAIPCALSMGAYVGLYGGIFCLFAFLLREYSPIRRTLALGILWYFLEFLRGWLLTGFPWAILSAAFVPWLIVIQSAALVGAYALSGILTSSALLIAESLFPPTFCTASPNKHIYTPQYRWILGAGGIGIIALLMLWGCYTIHTEPLNQTPHAANTFTVIMVEGNIDQNIKWESSLQKATIDTYTQLSRAALESLTAQTSNTPHNTLLIWPETSMPFYLEHHPQWGPAIVRFVQDIKIPLLLGAPGAVKKNDGTIELFNRAYLLNKNGKLSGFYDKIHLVPFGEYSPPWLHFSLLEPLLQGVGNFTPGKMQSPLRDTGLALGILICYEGIFPEIAQQHVAHGATLLAILSNDGWFGDSAAPIQHLQLSILRAVEQNRWLVRSTNTGISAIVDNKGRIRLRGTQFQAQSHTGQAQTIKEHSIFYYTAPWIPLLASCLLLLLLCAKCDKNAFLAKNINKECTL